jgi:hypothetical protein
MAAGPYFSIQLIRCSQTVDLPEPSLPITDISGGSLECITIISSEYIPIIYHLLQGLSLKVALIANERVKKIF